MAGEWDLLVDRAKYFVSNSSNKFKLYSIDSGFYVALASGDIQAMESCINELLTPKVSRYRDKEISWGLEQRLFSPWPFMLTKIAKIHGYTLAIESSWMPNELLNISPLNSYVDSVEFLHDYSLFELFQPSESCAVQGIQSLSPRPQGIEPLSFAEAFSLVRK
ncbi:hypothetical protein GCM10008940_00020 [Microbulbifer agarilyticus]